MSQNPAKRMKYEIEMPEFHCDFDLDLVTTSTEIVDYLASRCVEAAYLNRVGAYEETYAISQEIENDFDDICDKYLETGGSNSMDIEPYKSVFELLGHQIALKENDNGVSVLFDTDMSVIKFLINDVIVEMKCSILLKTVIDGFMYAYAYAGFPELARMFLVISRNCVIMMDIDEILEEGESMILLLDTELSFMERVLMKSLNVIKNGNSWTLTPIERMEFEVKLFNMLDILGYKDYYFDLPVIIKNLRQAEDFTSTMLAKVTKFENLSEKYERNLRFRAKSSYWRGLIFYSLAELNTDAKVKAVSVGKSQMYWNRVLQEYFKERQFIEYAKAPTKHSSDLRMFLVIMQLNTTDIDDRVERIMLKTPEEDPALLIKELNAVRKNVIRVFDLLFKYVHILEDLPQFKFNLIEISLNLAKQYRSIVITDYNQHQKESNIIESVRYLKMAACLEGDLKGDDLEEFLTDEADMIDAEDFNLKYCL